eukprot:scaffold12647_cov101-Isochrysis_galbana.AAC.1
MGGGKAAAGLSRARVARAARGRWNVGLCHVCGPCLVCPAALPNPPPSGPLPLRDCAPHQYPLLKQ